MRNNDFSFYFKNIIGSLDEWDEYIQNESYFTPTYTPDDTTDYIFKVLFRQYHNTPVMYYSKTDFLCDMANYFDNIYDKIKREIEILTKLYQLTDDELLSVSKVVSSSNELTNDAMNPADEVEDTTAPLQYIDSQTHDMLESQSEQTRGKLKAYLEALNNVPELRAKYIIRYFRPLFKNVYVGDTWLYAKGYPDDDEQE